jgi:AraC family transcriptional regulator, arabinose operon regulatory protein
MENAIIPAVPESVNLISLFHTPSEVAKDVFTTIPRAGHFRAGPEYRLERRVCLGHDLLFCLRGRGFIMAGGRTVRLLPDQMAWLEGAHPHAHWPDPSDPYELLWARIDGRIPEKIYQKLSLRDHPVVDVPNRVETVQIFGRLFDLMQTRTVAVDARLSAEADRLIAAVVEGLQRASYLPGNPSRVPAALQRTLDDLTIYFYRNWRLADLAQTAGMSQPHFFRCFRRLTGHTPIDWLRRERLNHAKRRLVESSDSIKEIAEQVGYSDQFWFSRDFKKFTTLSPSQYRNQEREPQR